MASHLNLLLSIRHDFFLWEVVLLRGKMPIWYQKSIWDLWEHFLIRFRVFDVWVKIFALSFSKFFFRVKIIVYFLISEERVPPCNHGRAHIILSKNSFCTIFNHNALVKIRIPGSKELSTNSFNKLDPIHQIMHGIRMTLWLNTLFLNCLGDFLRCCAYCKRLEAVFGIPCRCVLDPLLLLLSEKVIQFFVFVQLGHFEFVFFLLFLLL